LTKINCLIVVRPFCVPHWSLPLPISAHHSSSPRRAPLAASASTDTI